MLLVFRQAGKPSRDAHRLPAWTFLFLAIFAFAGCARPLLPELSGTSQITMYKGKPYLESSQAGSSVTIVGYHLDGDKLMMVLKCCNTDSLLVRFKPQNIRAYGFNQYGDSVELCVEAANKYVTSRYLVNFFEKDTRAMDKLRQVLLLDTAAQAAAPRHKVDGVGSISPQAYIEVRQEAVSDIMLFRDQYIMGSIVVTANASYSYRFRVAIPMGQSMHNIVFSGC